MSPVIKKKGEGFTLPSKYLLFILTIICAALMLLTFSTSILDKPLNTAAGYIVVPFQTGLSRAGEWLSNRSEELSQIRDLIEENENLKSQVAELSAENTTLQQEHYELVRLRELLELKEEYSQYDTVGARIIAKDSGNWYADFTIDKGTDDGLSVDMNVIADGGLVGRITSVGPNWAKVTSIISDGVNVSGAVMPSGDTLIVSGDLELMQEGLISFSQLMDSGSEFTVGSKVVTSSISDLYLPNILIGYLYSITADVNNLTYSGYITPAVDFSHLEEVLVITQLKQQVEDTDADD